MRDLSCDVTTCCARSCDTGKINASDKIMFETQKKRENMEIKDIFTLRQNDHLDKEFIA